MTAAIVGALAAASVATAPAQEGPARPASFVYLRDVDRQSFKTSDTPPTTISLADATTVTTHLNACCKRARLPPWQKRQSDLKTQGMSLKAYDCYRRQRAVGAFVAWTKAASESKAKKTFHPRLSRSQLLAQGYIAARSGHSRGIVVDSTPVRLPPPTLRRSTSQSSTRIAPRKKARGPEISIDFGTGSDCFDSRSNTAAELLTNEQRTRAPRWSPRWPNVGSQITGESGGTSPSASTTPAAAASTFPFEATQGEPQPITPQSPQNQQHSARWAPEIRRRFWPVLPHNPPFRGGGPF